MDGLDLTDEQQLLRDVFEDFSTESVTTHAACSRMKRLCADAGIERDDRHGYLAPHSGRRGMGEVLVRQFGYTTTARSLDNTGQMARERYSHIDAGEQADMAAEALAASDQWVQEPFDEQDRER